MFKVNLLNAVAHQHARKVVAHVDKLAFFVQHSNPMFYVIYNIQQAFPLQFFLDLSRLLTLHDLQLLCCW